MNVDALLACRVTGSRLHGKPLQNLTPDGPTIIESLVEYLKVIKNLRKIILCIAEGQENLIFLDVAKKLRLPFTFGPEKDVLGRLIQAGEHFDTDVVFRVTTESPFVLSQYADNAIQAFASQDYDWSHLDNSPEGTGFELVTLDALKKSHSLGTDRHRSELVTSYIADHTSDFRMLFYPIKESLRRPEVRLTVDYAEDLVFCQTAYRALKEPGKLINVSELVQFWDDNPDVRAPLEAIGIDWGHGRLDFMKG